MRLANNSIYGLSGSLWTRDLKRALRVARAIETGRALGEFEPAACSLSHRLAASSAAGSAELGMAALEGYTELKSIYFETEEGM